MMNLAVAQEIWKLSHDQMASIAIATGADAPAPEGLSCFQRICDNSGCSSGDLKSRQQPVWLVCHRRYAVRTGALPKRWSCNQGSCKELSLADCRVSEHRKFLRCNGDKAFYQFSFLASFGCSGVVFPDRPELFHRHHYRSFDAFYLYDCKLIFLVTTVTKINYPAS